MVEHGFEKLIEGCLFFFTFIDFGKTTSNVFIFCEFISFFLRQAESLLDPLDIGSFVVRPSSKQNCVALSFKQENKAVWF